MAVLLFLCFIVIKTAPLKRITAVYMTR